MFTAESRILPQRRSATPLTAARMGLGKLADLSPDRVEMFFQDLCLAYGLPGSVISSVLARAKTFSRRLSGDGLLLFMKGWRIRPSLACAAAPFPG